MSSDLYNLPLIEYHDLVCILNCTQTMSYHHYGPAPEKILQVVSPSLRIVENLP